MKAIKDWIRRVKKKFSNEPGKYLYLATDRTNTIFHYRGVVIGKDHESFVSLMDRKHGLQSIVSETFMGQVIDTTGVE